MSDFARWSKAVLKSGENGVINLFPTVEVPSKIMLAGDLHGNVNLLKQYIDNEDIACALQVGDFGIIKPSCVKKHNMKLPKRMNVGDYYKFVTPEEGGGFAELWFEENVFFCRGNHECPDCLEEFESNITVHSLFYLDNTTITEVIRDLHVASLGGNYSCKRSLLPKSALKGQYRKFFVREEIDELLGKRDKKVDILITHLGPTSIGITRKSSGSPYKMEENEDKDIGDPWIRELIETLQPKFHFFGHYHKMYNATIGKTRVIGLPAIEDGYGLLDRTDWSFRFVRRH